MVSQQAAESFVSSSWLSEIDLAARETLLEFLEEGRAKRGEVLLDDARANDRVWFLLEGQLQVTRHDEDLGTLPAPTMFGLTTFFRSSPPYYKAQAKSPLWYLTLDRAAHERLRRENPRVAEQLALAALHILADRIEAIDRRIMDQARSRDARQKDTEWSSFRARLIEESGL